MDATTSKGTSPKGKRGLRRKLILSMLLVGTLPLIIGLVMAFLQGTKEIREVNGESFEALATETAKTLDLVINEEIAMTSRITTDVEVISELEKRRDDLAEYDEQGLQALLDQENQKWSENDPKLTESITQGKLVQLLRRYYGGTVVDPGHPVPIVTRSATRGLFITDIEGRLVASMGGTVPYLHKKEPWWQGAFNKGVGEPYLGDIAFLEGAGKTDEEPGAYTFALSLPIMDSIRYQAIGVLHRIYDAKEFFSPTIDTILFGDTGHAMIIDGDGVVLRCPILPTGFRLTDTELIPLVTPMYNGWTEAPTDGHGGQRTEFLGFDLFPNIIGFAPLPNTSRITQDSTGKGWHLFVWQSSSELFAPIHQLFTWISVFGVLAVGLLVTLGAIASGRIVTPIRQLQKAATLIGSGPWQVEAGKRIMSGEWQEPVKIKTGDELEELADEVNKMSRQLASTFSGLESEVELKTQVLNSIPDPVLILNENQEVQYLNQASKEAFQLATNGEVEGQSLFQILHIDEATQQKLGREFQSIRANSISLDQVNLDSTPTSSTPIMKDPLHHHAKSDSSADRQEIHCDNGTFRYEWFTVGAQPGNDTGIGIVLRDLTKESRQQDQLIKEEKLAGLEILSQGIGHELNNPLVGVIGLGEAIQEEKSPDQVKEYAKTIVQHGRRMASIIRDFTGQATRQLKGKSTQVNLNEQLDHALNIVKNAHEGTKLDIQTHYQPLPVLAGNSEELGQALTNVITNAVQALNAKGKIEVSTVAEGENILLTIRDNGPGMSRSHLSKIFDPFFTTKRQGEGSGLGLTIARRIIQKHGGQIEIESDEGVGTTCRITFPIHRPSLS